MLNLSINFSALVFLLNTNSNMCYEIEELNFLFLEFFLYKFRGLNSDQR